MDQRTPLKCSFLPKQPILRGDPMYFCHQIYGISLYFTVGATIFNKKYFYLQKFNIQFFAPAFYTDFKKIQGAVAQIDGGDLNFSSWIWNPYTIHLST